MRAHCYALGTDGRDFRGIGRAWRTAAAPSGALGLVAKTKPLEVSFKTSEVASGFRLLPSFETVELVATALPGSLAAREYGRDYICRVGLERALPPVFDRSLPRCEVVYVQSYGALRSKTLGGESSLSVTRIDWTGSKAVE